jgi:hypothetical protein
MARAKVIKKPVSLIPMAMSFCYILERRYLERYYDY